MVQIQVNRKGLVISAWLVFLVLVMMSNVGTAADRLLKEKMNHEVPKEEEKTQGFIVRVAQFLWEGGKSAYEPVWPVKLASCC